MFALAVAALLATGHTTIRPSLDSDAPLPISGALVPVLAGLLLVRLIPPVAPALDPVSVRDRRSIGQVTWAMVAIAVGYPLLLFAVRAAGGSSDVVNATWALAKPLAFVLLPWLIIRRQGSRAPAAPGSGSRSARSWGRPREGWRWWGPVPALAVFAWLHLFGPVAGALPERDDYPDAAVLVVGASLTFLTANVTEELLYRVMLQSRLEATLGRWPGIIASGLLFALMHVAAHDQGESPLSGLALTLGAVVVFQGTFGLFVGYLWARYRNVWALVAAHTLVNTVPLLLM